VLLYRADEDVKKWVSQQLFNDDEWFSPLCTAIGVVQDDELIAGVVYSKYKPSLSMEMSVASIDKRWATRHNLSKFFEYPFIQLGLKRVQTVCSANEGDTIMFNQRLGFIQEGRHRQAFDNGDDAISFGMLESECKWIK